MEQTYLKGICDYLVLNRTDDGLIDGQVLCETTLKDGRKFKGKIIIADVVNKLGNEYDISSLRIKLTPTEGKRSRA